MSGEMTPAEAVARVRAFEREVARYNEMADDPDVGRVIPSRASDPGTSHAAAQSIIVSAKNQRGKLLRVYGGVDFGLTDDEAQERSGVSPHSCYWKRCSELRDGGYIAPTGRTRTGRAGVQRIVCQITDEGRRALRRIDE